MRAGELLSRFLVRNKKMPVGEKPTSKPFELHKSGVYELLTPETAVTCYEDILASQDHVGKFVRTGPHIVWTIQQLQHKDIAAKAGMAHPDDGGTFGAGNTTDGKKLTIRGVSTSLKKPISQEVRDKTNGMVESIFEGSGIQVKSLPLDSREIEKVLRR